MTNDPSIYELFHENSKLNEISEQDMSMRIAALYEDPPRLAASRSALKVYPYAPRIALPAPPARREPFGEVMRRRRSARQFGRRAVTREQLSSLLLESYGVTGTIEVEGVVVQKLRAAPSAGALYPIEIYPVVLSAGELDPGVYHYNVARHALELVRAGEFRAEVCSAMPAQFSLATVPLVLVLSAAFGKTTHKYGERGYRFVLLDAGHAMQNLCLTAAALDLACYTVGGFRDDELNALLGLDGVGETALYAALMGAPAAGEVGREGEY
jgi:SagB-type dehydrogenase family enzyme